MSPVEESASLSLRWSAKMTVRGLICAIGTLAAAGTSSSWNSCAAAPVQVAKQAAMRTAARWSLMASMLNSAAAKNNRDRLAAAVAGGPRHRDIRARRDIRADQDARSGMERASGYRRKGGYRGTAAGMARRLRYNCHDRRSFLHARRSEIAYHRFCQTDPSGVTRG